MAASRSTEARYARAGETKATGATYTPPELAAFVAERIVAARSPLTTAPGPLRILDPAVGDGELLVALLHALETRGAREARVTGFETAVSAAKIARARLRAAFPETAVAIHATSFLDPVVRARGLKAHARPAVATRARGYDLVIANPPYVRTQILGAYRAQRLAERFGLTGRVDLAHAFVLAIADALAGGGIAGLIVSNRFMTTRAGAAVREALCERLELLGLWDLGDTRLFGAAVLPAVLVARARSIETGCTRASTLPPASAIYACDGPAPASASSPVTALSHAGVVAVPDGRCFRVQHGRLDQGDAPGDVWRVATSEGDAWLAKVAAATWGRFADLGRVRVGVKTCADHVFIRADWASACGGRLPELLRPVTTHHVARRIRARPSARHILYPHTGSGRQRRPVDLAAHPISARYLAAFRAVLEGRRYVREAGRQWYELWVPQDPEAWHRPKLVFRDIAARPELWVDLDGSVVNGDCYWLVPERRESDAAALLWLAAAVGSSRFTETYYDARFCNRLYAGRRRFMTQYVEQLPLPDPRHPASLRIVTLAEELYAQIGESSTKMLENEIEAAVWRAFELSPAGAPPRIGA
jgi:hypothetical protein